MAYNMLGHVLQSWVIDYPRLAQIWIRMKFESLKTNSVLLLLPTINLMIGCSKKCGQNYPEKEQRRENETQVKNFTLGWCLST